MPAKDGFEVLKDLKKQKITTPVLVFSNIAQKEDEEETKSLGAKEYFTKANIAIDELIKIVKKYVK